MRIDRVGEADLDDLLPMMVAYCAFYEREPGAAALGALAASLLARPHEGAQLIARSDAGEPLGFATVYWTWQTTTATRLGVMNDLFVVPEARGRRIGEALIEACRGLAREHGAARISWQTAPDNLTAQRLYDRTGAKREQWIDYVLEAQD